MFEVFKTNVEEAEEATSIIERLQEEIPGARINIDLQDCDHVLRIEGGQFSVPQVMNLLQVEGYDCSVLE